LRRSHEVHDHHYEGHYGAHSHPHCARQMPWRRRH
jgi:hypothetical protein